MNISSEKLVEELQALELQERKLEEDVMDRLTEILRRRYYLDLGYPSLFEFCVKHLGYSAGKASRRISALKLMESLPEPKREEVREKLQTGTLTLTHLAQVQHVARMTQGIRKLDAGKILEKLENTTTRQAEKILALEFGVAVVHRESYRPITETEIKVSLVLDQETLDLIEKFKGLTAHQNPQGSTALALKLALQVALKKKDPAAKPSLDGFRVVPAPETRGRTTATRQSPQGPRLVRGRLRSLAFKQDRGSCSFVSPVTGKRCSSSYMLEVDHVIPYSCGGRTEIGNLRLLCRAHHQDRESRSAS